MCAIILYPHNQKAYKKIKQSIANGDKKLAISHATGTGKSYLIAKLCEDYNSEKKLILVPSKYIKKEIQSLLDENNIENVDVELYQWLIKVTDEDISAMDYKVVALDEYHHDTSKIWGSKIMTLINSHPETIFFGTSATPIRTDGINTIDELFNGNCVSNLTLAKAIAKKIVPKPKYVSALYTLDERLNELRKKVEKSTNSKEEKEEFYKKINAMRSQIEKSYGMPIILNNHIKDKEGKYIVFCKNTAHLKLIENTVVEWFKVAGFKNINSYVVHSLHKEKDKEYQSFCDDTSHNLKLLFCVNMFNEGLHLENISGVLLLRTTGSYIVLMQQVGRAIEASNLNTPLIIDAVNNFSYMKDGIKLLQEIKEEIAKEKKNNKDFDDSDFLDIDTFFVTEYICDVERMLNEIEDKLYNKITVDMVIEYLVKYKEQYGNLFVPYNYIADDGFKLGERCMWLRKKKNGWKHSNNYTIYLTEEEILKLNQIGFIWDKIDTVWNEKFDLVKEYCNVNNVTINDISHSVVYKKVRIGSWVHNQLANIRIGKYDNSYKKKSLLEYGLELDRQFYNWYKSYLDYVSYLKKNNLKCNQLTRGTIGESGINLYDFELVCKKSFKNGTLSDKKLELLKQCGFDFKFFKDKSNDIFKEKIERYLNDSKDNSSKSWICKINKKYDNDELSSNEIDLLKKYNIIDSFGVFYNLNKPYVAVYKYGKFLGKLYKSCKDLERDSLVDLGERIVANSVSSFCNNNYPYNTIHGFQFKYVTSREDILDGVDKPYLSLKDLNYKEKVKYLSEFYPNKVSKNMVYKDFHLGNWLCHQKTQFKKGKLSDLRLSFYNDMGVMDYLTS